MAYELTYKLEFTNKQTETVLIELWRKDVVPDDVIDLKATKCDHQYLNGNGNKFDTILASEAIIGIWLKITDTPTFEDFIVSFHDEWKVIIYNDSQEVFKGFLVPGEGHCDFRDKPYELILSATDGLGYLKEIPLTRVDGNNFVGLNYIVHYVLGALAKTGLKADLRIYCNIYEASMFDRNSNVTYDMFNKGRLHHRTFMNKNEFTNCYDALTIILKEGFSLYQWGGIWVINRVAEMNGVDNSIGRHTDYNWDDTFRSGADNVGSYCEVGANKRLHPINANQAISAAFALKSVRHTFKYEIPEELVNNQHLQNFTDFIAPLSGIGYTAWEMIGWSPFTGDYPSVTPYAGTSNAYIKQILDANNFETDRYYVIERDGSITSDLGVWIKNDNNDFWVTKGDKAKFDFAGKVKTFFPATILKAGRILLLTDGTDGTLSTHWYSLDVDGVWANNPTEVAFFLGALAAPLEWFSKSVEAEAFPVNGNIYILLGNAGDDLPNAFNEVHFKAVGIDYKSFINSTDTEVKGDYWQTTQSSNYKDKVTEDVSISDSLKKIFKGAMFEDTGTSLTVPTWRRLNNPGDAYHYKELINLGRYNQSYKRRWQIDGSFGGTKFTPVEDSTLFHPLSFHRHFLFNDDVRLAGKLFMLVPPLKIDYVNGDFDGVFIECWDTAESDSAGDTHDFKYIFE